MSIELREPGAALARAQRLHAGIPRVCSRRVIDTSAAEITVDDHRGLIDLAYDVYGRVRR